MPAQGREACTVTITRQQAPRDAQPAGGAPREPKYYGLKTYLLELTHTQPPGSPVPSERILAERFATSRTTVRQALQELVAEGRLSRLQGKGTFVAHPKVDQPLVLSSYTEDVSRRGATPSSRLLSLTVVAADAEVAEGLGLAAASKVIRLERLRLSDAEPMAHEVSHLSSERFPGLRRHLRRYTSLYSALETEYGVVPFEAEQTIETGTASPGIATLLGTEVGLPVLLLGRRTFDADGAPFEYVRAIYRGERFRLVARLTRPPS
jgi:GntR family transcriptional regulator, nutrient-sensing system regulator